MRTNLIYLLATCSLCFSCSEEIPADQNHPTLNKEVFISATVRAAVVPPTSLWLYVFRSDGTFVQQYSDKTTGLSVGIPFRLAFGSSYTLCLSVMPASPFVGARNDKVVLLAPTIERHKAIGGVLPYEQSSEPNLFFGTYDTGVITGTTASRITGVVLTRPEARVTIRGYTPLPGATKAYLRAPVSYGWFDLTKTYGGTLNAVIGTEIVFGSSATYDLSVKLLPTNNTDKASKTFILCVYYGGQNQWVEYPFVYESAAPLLAGNNYVFQQTDATLNFTPIIEELWGPDVTVNL
ncbi:MAG: hypothetical protein RSB23_05990 [Alistipes sp.]